MHCTEKLRRPTANRQKNLGIKTFNFGALLVAKAMKDKAHRSPPGGYFNFGWDLPSGHWDFSP
jgi:hypothetical protein